MTRKLASLYNLFGPIGSTSRGNLILFWLRLELFVYRGTSISNLFFEVVENEVLTTSHTKHFMYHSIYEQIQRRKKAMTAAVPTEVVVKKMTSEIYQQYLKTTQKVACICLWDLPHRLCASSIIRLPIL